MWFTRVSISNPVFATMAMAARVLGLFSYNQLRVEQMPDISLPFVFIPSPIRAPRPRRSRPR